MTGFKLLAVRDFFGYKEGWEMRGKTMHRKRHLLLYQFLMAFILATFILPNKAHAITGSAAPIEITKLVEDTDFDSHMSGRIPLILIHGIHGNQWPDGTDTIANPYRGYFLNLLNYLVPIRKLPSPGGRGLRGGGTNLEQNEITN